MDALQACEAKLQAEKALGDAFEWSVVVADAVAGQIDSTRDQTWLSHQRRCGFSARHHGRVSASHAATLRRRMAQLRLLALAAMADGPSVIGEFVGDRWPAESLFPRFMAHFHLPKDAETFPAMLDDVLGGAAHGELSSMKVKGVPELIKRAKAVGGGGIVELGLTFCHGKLTASLMVEMVAVLERFAKAQLRRSKLAPSVEFRVVALWFVNDCTVTSSAMDKLSEFLRTSENAYVRDLRLDEKAEITSDSLQRCLSPTLTTTVLPRRRLSLRHTANVIAVGGSLVRYSEEITSVHISITHRKFAASVAWLAFGFFHCDSSSKVSSLSLYLETSKQCKWEHRRFDSLEDWMPVFLRVLSCAVSSEDLAPIDAAGYDRTAENPLPTDGRVFVSLKPKATARAQPKADAAVVAVLATDGAHDRATEYQVLRRNGDWIAIAIPGLGCGWIRDRAVVSEQTRESAVVLGQVTLNQSIKSFAWHDGRSFELSMATELLSVIGGQLETLHLPTAPLNEAILPLCPRLRELVTVNSWRGNIERVATELKARTCALKRLGFTIHRETSVDQLIEIISMEGCPLQKLVVSAPNSHNVSVSSALARLVLHVILRASGLEYVRIECAQSTAAEMTKVLRDSGPLSSRAKAAFLSVVQRGSARDRAVGRVDSSVLSLILRLVAPVRGGFVEIQAHR